MKNIFLNKLFLLVLFGTFLGVLSCDKEEEEVIGVAVDNGKATLLSFGPSPALRGGELTFVGRHLDRVSEIVLPANVTVKDFKLKEAGKIVLVVPEATVNGPVLLKSSDGDIKALADLRISEPIALTSFTPAGARPGSTITITGTYLNLIKQIVFASNKPVDAKDFVSQTRDKIEVKIPLTAQTGKITMSNGEVEPIIIESDSILNVRLAAVTKVSPNPVKAGSNLTIEGTDLDLVKTFTFGGGKKATKVVSSTATKVVIEAPADAQDGKITMTHNSDVDVQSSDAVTMVVPSGITATPDPVKNGKVLTISGKDLDLVTTVVFGGSKTGKITSKTESKIEVEVPIDATDGTATLNTSSTKSVATAAITMVKPVLTSFSPTSIKANSTLTFSGTDLDLIKTIVFGGGKNVNVTNNTNATSLAVVVPSGTLTDKIKIITTNGTEITSTGTLTLLASNVPTVTGFPATAKPGQMITLTGTKMSLLTDVIFPDNVKASTFGVKTEDKIEVIVPLNVKLGKGKIKFMTAEGEISETDEISFAGVDPVKDPTLVFFNFDDKGAWWGKMQNNTRTDAEGISGKYGFVNESLSGWNDLFWRNGSNDFPGKVIGTKISEYVLKVDINIKDKLTGGAIVFRMKGDEGDFWYGVGPNSANAGNKTFLQTTGWETLTIKLSDFRDNFGWGSVGIKDLSKITAEFGAAWNDGASKVNILVDNVRFEKVTR
jgi:hypothetical protein